MANQKKILVMGIGNILFKDDGIGIHVVQRLMDMSLPPDVEVVDGGIQVTGFVNFISRRKKAIIVTAMKAGGPPGTIYRFSEQDMKEKRKGFSRTAQEMELTRDLEDATFGGMKPDETVFIGIEPQDMGEEGQKLEMGLSPAVEKKIPEIIDMVMREINTDAK